MLAHTDFVWAAHKDKESEFKQKFGSRPPHAVEGAYIAQEFLFNTLGEKLARPVVTAIARHHAPTALDLSNYKLHRAAGAALEEALQLIQAGEPWKILPDTLPPAKKDGLSQLDRDLITMAGKSTSYTLVYMLIVRVLRLADQASFEFARVHSKKA